MADRSTIPQFTGAAYQGWAYKVRYGLMEKDLHSCVFGFRGGARTPCPVLIPLLTQAELLALKLMWVQMLSARTLLFLQIANVMWMHGC